MVLFNYATRELTAKIVYYGAGLCGKTTNLEYIHKSLPEKTRGKMLSLATQTDRTLFFDFLPIDLGSVKGMKTRVQLYTVPGQVFYDATRKLVLKGADGVVFVVDSQRQMLDSNLDSLQNLAQNLQENNLDINAIPLVVQYNKRDLPDLLTIKEMNQKINRTNAPFYEAIAITGYGVQDTLKGIATIVLQTLSRRYSKEEKEEPIPTLEKTVVTAPPKEPEVESIDLTPLVEEVKELPNADELEVHEEITLDPVVDVAAQSIEDSVSLGELEEVHELQPEIQEEYAATAVAVESLPSSEMSEEYSAPAELSSSNVSASASVAVDVSKSKRPSLPPDLQQLEEQLGRRKLTTKKMVRTADRDSVASVAPQQHVNIPVEVSVDRNGQEIKLHLSIDLKINLE